MHKLHDDWHVSVLKMLEIFCEIMFKLVGRKLTLIFHTVGKKPAV